MSRALRFCNVQICSEKRVECEPAEGVTSCFFTSYPGTSTITYSWWPIGDQQGGSRNTAKHTPHTV